jgi:hypothetical protein
MISTTAGRQKGLILVAASAMLFSTPGLFTRSVEASGWDVIFWRGAFGIALGIVPFALIPIYSSFIYRVFYELELETLKLTSQVLAVALLMKLGAIEPTASTPKAYRVSS